MREARQMNAPEPTIETAPAAAPQSTGAQRPPWLWIPTLYFAEGLPNAVVVTVSLVMYKDLGLSNTANTFWTSLLYLAWVVKPLWSPFVDILGTRRRWTWVTQLLMALALGGVALRVPMPDMLPWTLAFFWLIAFTSATHDIAADGFYMLALDQSRQAFYVGVRTLFYRLSAMFAGGIFLQWAGSLIEHSGGPARGWSTAVGTLAGIIGVLGMWHAVSLPKPASDRPGEARRVGELLREFGATFTTFFQKPGIGRLLAFLLLYRFGEAQLVKMVAPFLKDARDVGGLGLTTAQFGNVYGIYGIAALSVGGILGGIVTSRHGLRRWLWPMVFALHLPDLVFLYLAHVQPTDLMIIRVGVMIEQFGYGFGFTAYVLYMLYLSRGQHQTAHYAICTGFMAMGLMFPGMWSGWLQDHIGYKHFFAWVIVATLPGFWVAARVPLEENFGKKAAKA
jgi:PAT family beta-lactamase induction signal transducer AmpG